MFVSPPDSRMVVREAQERVVEVEEKNLQLRAELARRPEPMPIEALAGRLRALAVLAQTPLQFSGLAHHGRGSVVMLEEIFVHRTFTTHTGPTLDHEGLLADLDANVAPRYEIIGAAGAGKTTLCSWLIGALGQRGRIGLFVRLRALGEVGGSRRAARRGGAVARRADLPAGHGRGRDAAARRRLDDHAVRWVRRAHQFRRSRADHGAASGVRVALPGRTVGRHQPRAGAPPDAAGPPVRALAA